MKRRKGRARTQRHHKHCLKKNKVRVINTHQPPQKQAPDAERRTYDRRQGGQGGGQAGAPWPPQGLGTHRWLALILMYRLGGRQEGEEGQTKQKGESGTSA